MEADSPPRPPRETDLIGLCKALNEQGARYIVVGGMAVIHHGFLRATEDIDLLLERSRDNQAKVFAALEILSDKAVRQIKETDLDQYTVVRVADEIVVDLMLSACGVSYDEAVDQIERQDIEGVTIPFPTLGLLLRMKQTYRDKDVMDRKFLETKLKEKSV
jgi:ferredoxin-fold anticodon binding domain-containing protein